MKKIHPRQQNKQTKPLYAKMGVKKTMTHFVTANCAGYLKGKTHVGEWWAMKL